MIPLDEAPPGIVSNDYRKNESKGKGKAIEPEVTNKESGKRGRGRPRKDRAQSVADSAKREELR